MRGFLIILVLWIFFSSHCFSQQPATPAWEWNEIAVYDCQYVEGLTFDGHDIFTLGGGSPYPYSSFLNKFNPIDTSFSNLCGIPTEGIQYQCCQGLTYKSPWFVTTDQWFNGSWFEPARAVYFDTAGNLQGSSILPQLDTHIIAWDKKNSHLWGAVPIGDKIMKINSSGNILMTIGPLPFGISNLCTQGNYIWVASTNDTIYLIDYNGTILNQHTSSYGIPLAIVFDDHYLWYSCQYKLVKVEVTGVVIPDLESTSEQILHIHPNPSSNKITIENIDKGTLSIFTINGQEIIHVETTEPTTIIDVTTLTAGIYFIKRVDEKGVRMGKLIRP